MSDDERLEAIDFHGMELWASVQGETDADVWVPVAPICQHLELDTAGQGRVIQKSPTFDQRYRLMSVPSRGGVQETLALRLDTVNLWLAGISPRRVKDPRKRDRLVLYQRECAQILYQHFFTTPRGRSVQIETQIPLFFVQHIDELRQDVRMGFAHIESKIEATTFRMQDLVEPIGRETREIREQLQLFSVLVTDVHDDVRAGTRCTNGLIGDLIERSQLVTPAEPHHPGRPTHPSRPRPTGCRCDLPSKPLAHRGGRRPMSRYTPHASYTCPVHQPAADLL
jgi:P22_AR N-terminal domain